MQTRQVTWKALAWEGTERATLSVSDAGIEVRSELKGVAEDGTPYELRYVMELSPDWQVQHVHIADARDEGGSLDLVYENDQWFAGPDHLDEFDGVPFIDMSLTPFTNTLPIKRLHFQGEESQKIDVLYIDLPGLALRRVEQLYSRIGKSTYHYQDIGRPDFQADIVVDDDGLVVVYPNLFISAVE